MKFLLISPKNRTVYNFRGNLIKDIINKGYEVIVTGPDQIDIDKIYSLGVSFKEVEMNKNGTNIVKDIKYLKNLFQIMKKEKPDIVLGYTIKPVIYGSIAAKIAGIKNINCMITGAGYVFTSKTLKAKFLGFIVKILYKIGLAFADNIIFQNKDDLKEFVEKKLVNEKKCYVVNGSGVDMKKFTQVSFPKQINFFMLSRLLKSKGIIEYLNAAKFLKRKYPNVCFTLLGKYETSMQDAIEKEYIENFIKEGIIERYDETSDVRPFYEKCSVYVLPSYREGTPRTVLEAMAMGRPIITTNTNGCRDTVEEGINGFLVPIMNSEILADRMERFILKPELIEIYGKASYKICCEKYDVIKVNKNMLKIMKLEEKKNVTI